MFTLNHLFAVSVGAAGGAVVRWLLGVWLNQSAVLLPWGTLAANLAGGYLIGLALALFMLFPSVPEWMRLVIATGFLGGLTTFSTFSAEIVGLLVRGAYLLAIGYAGLSLFGALLFTALGFATVQVFR